MAATTKDIQTPAMHIERMMPALKLETTATGAAAIFAGIGVCTNAAGNAVAAGDVAGLVTQGRAEHPADYAAGDREIETTRGVFGFIQDGNITQAMVGGPAYWLDNQTLTTAAVAANDIIAGYIEKVDAPSTAGTRVWISMLGGKVAAT